MFLHSLAHLFETCNCNLLHWALGIQTPIRHIKSANLVKGEFIVFGQETVSRLVNRTRSWEVMEFKIMNTDQQNLVKEWE